MTDYNGPFDIIGKVAVPAALAVGTGVAALANDKNVQRSAGNIANNIGNGVSNAVNGVGAKLSDLGKFSSGIINGLSAQFNHGVGNTSYLKNIGNHNGTASSMAVSPTKPNVMSNPGVAMPRGGTSVGTPSRTGTFRDGIMSTPSHTATLRGGTMTTPSRTTTAKGGTMSTPAHSPSLSGVTELPDTAVKTGALAGTKTLANTDALVAERTLPRLPKEEVTSKLPKLDIPNALTVPPLTLDQESANIGRANNFKLGADN